MQETHCPLCNSELEVREVTPCEECGANSEEIEHFRSHTYTEYQVFPELNLVLCNFCDVDFGSYDPAYFGLPAGKRIGYERMNFIRKINNPTISIDKYCGVCGYRLAFLRFVNKARQQHLH